MNWISDSKFVTFTALPKTELQKFSGEKEKTKLAIGLETKYET